ncbi:hypothetical protein Bca4012_092624 [Brassica carinata]
MKRKNPLPFARPEMINLSLNLLMVCKISVTSGCYPHKELEDHDDLPEAIIQIGCKTSLSESMLTRITLFMVPGFTRLEGSIKI